MKKSKSKMRRKMDLRYKKKIWVKKCKILVNKYIKVHKTLKI